MLQLHQFASCNPLHGKISVEVDSHADTCVVGSNVLVVHDHEHFNNIYGFNKETRLSNICTINAAIAYKDPIIFYSDPHDQSGYQD